MRWGATFILLLTPSLLFAAPPLADGDETSPPATERTLPADARPAQLPRIRPLPDQRWGASPADVRKVLDSTAAQLWGYFPDRKQATIIVSPRGGPITLFERGPAGEYQVRLDTGDTYWAQYAFQFAHELGHILSGYREGGRNNKWFEESLCELASLFALRRMSDAWEEAPPYPNWRSFAPALNRYAQERIDDARLPQGTTLAAWYRERADRLARDPTRRELNNVVAVALLPHFEAAPEHWEAIGWLNTGRGERPQTFPQYLSAWRDHAPPRHRAFIGRLAGELGVRLAPPAP